ETGTVAQTGGPAVSDAAKVLTQEGDGLDERPGVVGEAGHKNERRAVAPGVIGAAIPAGVADAGEGFALEAVQGVGEGDRPEVKRARGQRTVGTDFKRHGILR